MLRQIVSTSTDQAHRIQHANVCLGVDESPLGTRFSDADAACAYPRLRRRDPCAAAALRREGLEAALANMKRERRASPASSRRQRRRSASRSPAGMGPTGDGTGRSACSPTLSWSAGSSSAARRRRCFTCFTNESRLLCARCGASHPTRTWRSSAPWRTRSGLPPPVRRQPPRGLPRRDEQTTRGRSGDADPRAARRAAAVRLRILAQRHARHFHEGRAVARLASRRRDDAADEGGLRASGA